MTPFSRLENASKCEHFGVLAVPSRVIKASNNRDRIRKFSENEIRALSQSARAIVEIASRRGVTDREIVSKDLSLHFQREADRDTVFIAIARINDRVIAVGDRGTAFANITKAQITELQFNAWNDVLNYTGRTATQLAKRNAGLWQNDLRADSCSWLSPRGSRFWIGTLANALGQKLVREVSVTVRNGNTTESLTGYVRTDLKQLRGLASHHKVIAVKTPDGRIEARRIQTEDLSGHRNLPFVRKVLNLEFTGGE